MQCNYSPYGTQFSPFGQQQRDSIFGQQYGQCGQQFHRFNTVNPFKNPRPEVVGEGDVTTMLLPDGSTQMYFIPASPSSKYCPIPVNPTFGNGLQFPGLNQPIYFIRSVANPAPLFQQSQPQQSPQFGFSYPTPPIEYPPNNPLPPPTKLQFHNDNCTSTSDLRYFFPQPRSSPKAPNTTCEAIQASTPIDSGTGPAMTFEHCAASQAPMAMEIGTCPDTVLEQAKNTTNAEIQTSNFDFCDCTRSSKVKEPEKFKKSAIAINPAIEEKKPKVECECKVVSDTGLDLGSPSKASLKSCSTCSSCHPGHKDKKKVKKSKKRKRTASESSVASTILIHSDGSDIDISGPTSRTSVSFKDEPKQKKQKNEERKDKKQKKEKVPKVKKSKKRKRTASESSVASSIETSDGSKTNISDTTSQASVSFKDEPKQKKQKKEKVPKVKKPKKSKRTASESSVASSIESYSGCDGSKMDTSDTTSQTSESPKKEPKQKKQKEKKVKDKKHKKEKVPKEKKSKKEKLNKSTSDHIDPIVKDTPRKSEVSLASSTSSDVSSRTCCSNASLQSSSIAKEQKQPKKSKEKKEKDSDIKKEIKERKHKLRKEMKEQESMLKKELKQKLSQIKKEMKEKESDLKKEMKETESKVKNEIKKTNSKKEKQSKNKEQNTESKHEVPGKETEKEKQDSDDACDCSRICSSTATAPNEECNCCSSTALLKKDFCCMTSQQLDKYFYVDSVVNRDDSDETSRFIANTNLDPNVPGQKVIWYPENQVLNDYLATQYRLEVLNERSKTATTDSLSADDSFTTVSYDESSII